jgi:chromate transporter
MVTRSPWVVLAVFLRLGCLSFGGPIAHLGYFREEFVGRRRWLDDEAFSECVALTQLLPGPSSSQVAMLLGSLAAGPFGAAAAWVGFTAPSAVAMATLALAFPHAALGHRIEGLLLVATAVVADAVVTMRATLAPDAARLVLTLATFAAVLLVPAPWIGPAAIGACALAGLAILRGRVATTQPRLDFGVSRAVGIASLCALGVTFVVLGVLARASHSPAAVLANEFFRIGSLVFGGGHVVLPLMQSQLASAGIVSQDAILSGYAAAQAMPGPLFTIASFAGACAFGGALGWCGALLSTVAIFAPSFFLLAGIAPFYKSLARRDGFRAALAGANASVVGLLAAALVTPIATSAIHSALDAFVVVVAFAALRFGRVPSWGLALLGALAGFL